MFFTIIDFQFEKFGVGSMKLVIRIDLLLDLQPSAWFVLVCFITAAVRLRVSPNSTRRGRSMVLMLRYILL